MNDMNWVNDLYWLLFPFGIWIVVVVAKGKTVTIYQGNTERGATKYMTRHVQEKHGKVFKHIKEDHGQTWEVKTPDGETSYYTTMDTEDTEDDNL